MLYVTSMNKRLYKATGSQMIESFRKFDLLSSLAVFVEDDLKIPDVDVYYICRDKFLNDWLRENADIIPYEFGGTFRCKCNYNIKFKQKGHKDNCPAGGMRRRAAHWIKKVATWNRMKELNQDYVVWLDCDSVMKTPHPNNFFSLRQQENKPVLFHYGRLRSAFDTGFETGITLFDYEYGAEEKVIQPLIKRFTSGEFRKEKRWDDAWMLYRICKDDCFMAGDLTPNCNSSDPVRFGPFSDYFEHLKGIHWKEHGING